MAMSKQESKKLETRMKYETKKNEIVIIIIMKTKEKKVWGLNCVTENNETPKKRRHRWTWSNNNKKNKQWNCILWHFWNIKNH